MLIACGQGGFEEATSAETLGRCTRETHILRKGGRTIGAGIWARGCSSARRSLTIDCRRRRSSGELGINGDGRGKILVLRIVVRPSQSLGIQRWDMVLAAQSTQGISQSSAQQRTIPQHISIHVPGSRDRSRILDWFGACAATVLNIVVGRDRRVWVITVWRGCIVGVVCIHLSRQYSRGKYEAYSWLDLGLKRRNTEQHRRSGRHERTDDWILNNVVVNALGSLQRQFKTVARKKHVVC